VPIHVIPRPVDPGVFERPVVKDPFPASFARGKRLLCVCRHTREKDVDRLLRLFATQILPAMPGASLTLVGDGPDHDAYEELARKLGVEDRVYFPGEHPVTEMASFYRNADLFVYASLSETYGQVVSEALWCGLPVVAFDDKMGVSHQLESEDIGRLIATGPNRERADQEFAGEVLSLLRDPEARRMLSERASLVSHRRSDPELCVARHYAAFLEAREHCASTWQPSFMSTRATPLARWTALHGLLYGLGRLRQPATLNRHGRKQPNWEQNLAVELELELQASPSTRQAPVSVTLTRERKTVLPSAASAA
jgi:glycosyltransferase involved in cell wall biosynthesis